MEQKVKSTYNNGIINFTYTPKEGQILDLSKMKICATIKNDTDPYIYENIPITQYTVNGITKNGKDLGKLY